MPRVISASFALTKASADITKGLVLIAPKVSGAPRAKFAELLKQVQLGLNVSILLSQVLGQILQGAVAISQLAGSLC